MAQQNRFRIPHTKKRTGCLTCKARRVKCDERKPTCYQCERLAKVCLGYPSKQPPPPRPSIPEECSPNHQVQQLKPLKPKKLPSALQLASEPSSLMLFECEQDFSYFNVFSERMAAELSPYFDPGQWNRTILQACAADSSIRGAAIAIGALGKTLELSRDCSSERRPPWSRGSSPETDEVAKDAIAHHQYALRQYDRAIKSMRENISCGKQSLRMILITCIVIICFEALYGNHESALFQLQSGIAMISEWKAKQKDAEKHPLGFSSPAPDTIEDFLVQVFGRMEIQTMTSFDGRSPEAHRRLKDEGKNVIEKMPSKFESIEEARIYIDLILRRGMHFSAAQESSTSVSTTISTEPPRKTANNRFQFNDVDIATHSLNEEDPIAPPIPLTTLTEHSALTTEIPAWNAAFTPLLTRCLPPSAPIRDRISALTMQLAALACHICIHAGFFKQECMYDVFLPDFKQIVDFSRMLLESQEREIKEKGGQRGRIAFSFEIALIPPLFLAAIKCRERSVRMQALELLERYPRREGVYDSVVIAAASRWGIEFEEGAREIDEEMLAENKRVRKIAVKFDLVSRRSVMSCLQFDASVGRWVPRRKIHCW